MSDTWNARDYAASSTAQETWANELIEKLSFTGRETLLDIGCGDGKITYRMAKILGAGRVTGIDRSQNMIEFAAQTFAAPNLDFVQMCATQIKLCEKYDMAFSNAALHWVSDHAAVLRSLRANLKQGARILLQMGGAGNAAELFDVIDALIASQAWRAYFEDFQFPYTFCDVDYYHELLSSCGYQPRRLELIPKDMVHADRSGFVGWLRTTWFPYTERLPTGELREKFLHDLGDAYLRRCPVDTKGQTHVKMVRLEVEAVAI